MDKKPEHICPICQRPNDAAAERCWYCQAVLSQDEPEEKKGNSDWLDGLREGSEKSDESIPAEAPTSSGSEHPEEVPDWLARIRTRELIERENQANSAKDEDTAESSDENLPDWLKEIKSGNSNGKPEPYEPEPASVPPFEVSSFEETTSAASSGQVNEDDTQEWLSKLASWQPSEPAAEETKPSDIFSAEPKIDKSEQYRGLEEKPQIPSEPVSESPDESFEALGLDKAQGWQKIFPDESEPAPEKPSEILETPKTLPAAPDHSEPAFDFEAFRSEASPQKEQPVVSDETSSAVFSGKAEPAGEEKEETAPEFFDTSPFVPDDLPDWLATATLGKQDKKEEVVTSEAETTPSEQSQDKPKLPDWLQSMRPAAAEAFTNVDENSAQISDEKGLLAGIPGTLHSPENKVDFRKPLGYGSALKISERQKANAALFSSMAEDLFDDDEEAAPKKGKTLRIIFQLLLGVVLIVVMYFSKSNLNDFAIQPALFGPEVIDVFDSINAIPDGKPVLLTADFEAATYGELSWSAQTLLEHLMRRNLSVVLLSTDPAGTTMLTQQMQTVNQKITSYDLDTQLVNLGYLAGGSTGLQFLSGDLRAALPYTHEFEQAWLSPNLESVQSLNDFGAVIVVSDNAEHARFWIEQIEPGLADTPLMFVISAQAAPLLQPYYQSGQVTGYVAGFNGSLTYEQVFAQPSVVTEHLSSFQAGLLFLAILILVGGLIALVRPDPADRKG